MECKMETMCRKGLSLFFSVFMLVLSSVGTLSACAEESMDDSSSQAAPSAEVTADGHIDADRLTQWVDAYLKTDGWDALQCALSIGLWYPSTDETWLYNPDEWMYGVNWSKLPISMVFAEKLANRELTNDTVITGITLEYALQTVLEDSSGPSFYSMVTYLGGDTVSNCAELVPQYAGLPDSYYTEDFYQKSYYTARIMMEVTKTLYLGGDERFPNVLEYMKQSQPWDMFKRDENIRVNLNASQTHAASWGDGAGDYIHCTGVIYTPTPIVLTIMMKNISDLDILGGIAGHIAVMATELDARQQELKSLAEETTAPFSEEAADENMPGDSSVSDSDSEQNNAENTPPADNSPDAAEQVGITETESPDRETAPGETDASPTPRLLLIAVSTLILLSLIAIAVSLRIRKKTERRR